MALCLVVTGMYVPYEASAETDSENGIFDVYHPASGVECYPRMFTTSKGTVLCAFDTEGVSVL